MMVGRLLSYWEGNFSGAMLNFGRVPDSLKPFFWRQVKMHTQLHVLWHGDERLMWMVRIRISKGQTLNLCNSKLQWIGGFQQSNEIWEMVVLPFYQSYWFVTAGSFRIIQVKCISKSSWKKCLNPLKNAFDFQVPNSGRDTPYLLSAVLWLEGCVIFVPMETHDDTDSDLCSFWFLRRLAKKHIKQVDHQTSGRHRWFQFLVTSMSEALLARIHFAKG